jgi:hypothetical protein
MGPKEYRISNNELRMMKFILCPIGFIVRHSLFDIRYSLFVAFIVLAPLQLAAKQLPTPLFAGRPVFQQADQRLKAAGIAAPAQAGNAADHRGRDDRCMTEFLPGVDI